MTEPLRATESVRDHMHAIRECDLSPDEHEHAVNVILEHGSLVEAVVLASDPFVDRAALFERLARDEPGVPRSVRSFHWIEATRALALSQGITKDAIEQAFQACVDLGPPVRIAQFGARVPGADHEHVVHALLVHGDARDWLDAFKAITRLDGAYRMLVHRFVAESTPDMLVAFCEQAEGPDLETGLAPGAIASAVEPVVLDDPEADVDTLVRLARLPGTNTDRIRLTVLERTAPELLQTDPAYLGYRIEKALTEPEPEGLEQSTTPA